MYRLENNDIPAILNNIVKKARAQIPNKIFELKLHLKKVVFYQ